MKTWPILIILVTSTLMASCASGRLTERDYLKKVEAIVIGADQSAVLSAFGKPSETQSDAEGAIWTYNINWKSYQVPKTIFWIDKAGLVVGKHINLSQEPNDRMIKDEAERRFRGAKFALVKQSPPKNSHHISSTKIIEDEAAGISIRYNSSRENEVESIRWISPEALKPVTSSVDSHP